MVKVPSLFLGDEELGKKDDDHRVDRRRQGAIWFPSAPLMIQHPRRLLKRLAIVAVAAFLVYQFVANMPTDVPIRDHRRPSYHHTDRAGAVRQPPPVEGHSPKEAARKDVPPSGIANLQPSDSSGPGSAPPRRSYNGPVFFKALANSLHNILETRGTIKINKNVLFVGASPKSVGTLLPLACQMGQEVRSYVHFALMSPNEIGLAELKKIHSVDKSCRIFFHDARPDQPLSSTTDRLAEAVTKAFANINFYMHPQAIIMDNSESEEPYFIKATRNHAASHKTPLIELPSRGVERLSWITKLDSASLAAWNEVSFDILVHVTPGTSGSLLRLLRSLSGADYSSSEAPQITLDLPHRIDAPGEAILQSLVWPPPSTSDPAPRLRGLSIRHRISSTRLAEDESSVRFFESFWPAKPRYSHVLVLSPEVELSPNYFHYLKYTVLEYLYSSGAAVQKWENRLFGISLVPPNAYLNGSTPFNPPDQADSEFTGELQPVDMPSPFLWQGPDSRAILVLGSKWAEIHGYVSQVHDLKRQSKPDEVPRLISKKAVSLDHPAWLEHMLSISRARGYLTMYPSPAATVQIATVHSETAQPPEEYAGQQQQQQQSSNRGKGGGDENVILAQGLLLDLLPEKDPLPSLYQLPWMTWNGEAVGLADLTVRAAEYTDEFRSSVSRCKINPGAARNIDRFAADLFCNL